MSVCEPEGGWRSFVKSLQSSGWVWCFTNTKQRPSLFLKTSAGGHFNQSWSVLWGITHTQPPKGREMYKLSTLMSHYKMIKRKYVYLYYISHSVRCTISHICIFYILYECTFCVLLYLSVSLRLPVNVCLHIRLWMSVAWFHSVCVYSIQILFIVTHIQWKCLWNIVQV